MEKLDELLNKDNPNNIPTHPDREINEEEQKKIDEWKIVVANDVKLIIITYIG